MILHIADGGTWRAAVRTGRYLPAGFDREGFVHCCERDQLLRVARARFRGVSGLVLLCIDEARLTSPVRHERADDVAEDFPHVYGPVDVAAVVAVLPFREGPRGFEQPVIPASAPPPPDR